MFASTKDQQNSLHKSKSSFNIEKSINAIITLAAPHHSFPYAFDESVYRFYQSVNQWWISNGHYHENCEDCSSLNNIPVLSISGGLRDELVHPNLCNLEEFHPSSISVSDMTYKSILLPRYLTNFPTQSL